MISLNVIPFELESEMPLDEMIERLNMLEQNNLVGGACAKIHLALLTALLMIFVGVILVKFL
ncbi:hypothetical protein ACIXNK_00810 [Bacteroides fragilis]